MAAPIVEWCRHLLRRRFVRSGVPFLVLMVAGSFGLTRFTSLRYQYREGKMVNPDEIEEHVMKMKQETSLEKELENLQEMNIDTWENIRGPRPGEDSKQIQDLQREKFSQGT